MNILKSFLKRLFIVIVPFLGLYYYSEIAFEANRQKEHPTDAGLGIAVFLFFILFFLFLGFIIDTILRIVKKEHKTVLINIIFLLPFLFLILYIATLFSGGSLYEIVKNFNNQEFVYLVLIYLVLISLGFLIVYKNPLKKTIIYLTILSCIAGGYFYNKHSIEEYYGKNKDIYFQGKSNDTIIVLASDNMSVITEGKIERKTWNRVYIKTDKNTVELNDWIKPIAREYSDSIKCEFRH
ncbi:hypothetical protein [Flavobacterium sp. H122]|uniref:hypothetical protein n=1 Tax=Flavobacterium sp. H122 TaxID=2529860 RepID=UPI001B7D7F3A|nr:hypothetical protein [Flavobacterium sp. H122]